MLAALAEWVKKLDRDLLRDFKTNNYNIHKIGNVAVVVLWSLYMATIHPDDIAMWMAYATVVMGASALQYGQKRTADRKDVQGDTPPAGPTTSMSVAGDATVKQ